MRFLPEWHVNLVVCPLNYLRLKSKRAHRGDQDDCCHGLVLFAGLIQFTR